MAKATNKALAKLTAAYPDAKVTTQAEFELGAGRPYDSLLCVFWGTGVGGGLAVATHCDLRLATPGSRFGYPIARTLGITAQTLRNHLHHINRKLRTHNRLEAVTPVAAVTQRAASLETPK